MYKIYFTKKAMKDRRLMAQAGLESRAKALLNVIMADPFHTPPPCEKLVGDLAGYYSRRISLQHRLVYSVDVEGNTVKVRSMWDHYPK
jgi:Txe/YoeB family toxin of toxin-antitoxin system